MSDWGSNTADYKQENLISFERIFYDSSGQPNGYCMHFYKEKNETPEKTHIDNIIYRNRKCAESRF